MVLLEVVGLAATAGVSFLGYLKTRSFVRERLRFVDAVQKGSAPVLAGGATAVAVALLPFIGFFPVGLAVGIGVGLGVSHGARDTRKQLTP